MKTSHLLVESFEKPDKASLRAPLFSGTKQSPSDNFHYGDCFARSSLAMTKIFQRTLIQKAVLISLLFCCGRLTAQVENMPLPVFINKPCFFIEGISNVKDLYPEIAEMAGGETKIFNKKANVRYVIDGESSSVSIKSSAPYVFMVRLKSGAETFREPSPLGLDDYNDSRKLYKLKVTEKKRKAYSKIDEIPYKLEKIADDVYKIIPEQKLEKGEYMFHAVEVRSHKGIFGPVSYTFRIE